MKVISPITDLDKLLENQSRLVTDGGRYTDTHYAWYDPDTGGYLHHTEANGEYANPFFEEEEDARTYLRQKAEIGSKQEYDNLSLHKLRSKKIGEAVEELTNQAGIGDFVPDGGHQIPNPQPEKVWFWYDPAADYIVQEEVEPYDVRGVFETTLDANKFLNWYANRHDIQDATRYELYSTDITYEGQGRIYDNEAETEEPPEQASFSDYLESSNGDDS